MMLTAPGSISRYFSISSGPAKDRREEPIWLESNIDEFRRLDHTRFRQDSFIEPLDFDYLEIRVLEE